ncbi:hypothetical protein R6Q59_018160 [Mikania micrantha]
MEGTCQNHHNKENIPPFFTINKSIDNKLATKMTLKKKNKHRKPLIDITNLIVNQSPVISYAVPRLQLRSVCRLSAAFPSSPSTSPLAEACPSLALGGVGAAVVVEPIDLTLLAELVSLPPLSALFSSLLFSSHSLHLKKFE